MQQQTFFETQTVNLQTNTSSITMSNPVDHDVDNEDDPLSLTTDPATQNDWISAFNTSILSTRAELIKDRTHELKALIDTPEFECLLLAAQKLAEREGLTKEQATERLVSTFRKIDFVWKQYLLQKGLDTLVR